ncbi:hypothetical protein ID850_19240 [Xenorhabdus sp. Flor]|nr:hypothetical protein [Xenorhabdus sp. Flor]
MQQQPDGVRLIGIDETGQQVALTLTSDTWFARSGLTKDFYFKAKQLCKCKRLIQTVLTMRC